MEFSIIIATHARPQQLSQCLESLTRLDFPSDQFEVIVVDDESDPPIEAVALQFADRLNLTCVTQKRGGPARARNTGMERARGQYLCFTDDDCKPAPDWLHAIAERIKLTPLAMVGGYVVNGLTTNLFSTTSQLLQDYLYEYYHLQHHSGRFFTSNNMVVSRQQFTEIKGFDDVNFFRSAGEDREVSHRWERHGFQMVYAPEVIIYHYHQLTFSQFWRQHFQYGRGAFRYHRLRSNLNLQRIRVEPPIFYLKLVFYPFTRFPLSRACVLTLLLFMTQVANAAGFFAETRRKSYPSAVSNQ
ncbi:MAG TPA: glycosyltransferase [Acidobacteriota bacterium]|nr:glycosyltransferase [Acidobacteriota bacterium]